MSDEILNRLEIKLEKMDEKIDKLDSRMDESNIIQTRHDENLKDHSRRSLAAEESIEFLKDELKPIKVHVNRVQGGLQFLGILGTIATIIGVVLKLLGKL